MSEIWNLSTLCRCCHADGNFKSLKLSYEGENDVEIYEIILRETLGITLSTPPLEASYSICDNCIRKLRDASNFKNQVLLCEEKFKVYCQNEQFFATQDIKIEANDDIRNDTPDDIHDGDDFETTDKLVDVDVEVKKEYSIEVDIGHPIEEFKKEEPTEEDKAIKTEVTTTTAKKTSNKKDIVVQKNIEIEQRRIELRNSLTIQVKTNNVTQYSCKDCGGQYPNKKELNKHFTSEHPTPYKCEHCEKILKTFTIYKRHVVQHTDKHFKCRHCGIYFKGQIALSEHIKLHTTEQTKKTYICDLCNKQFVSKQTIVKHLRIHNGTNKRKLCDLCGWSFNDQANLENHIRSVHERLRPYQCKYCGKKYSTKRHLKNHLQRHEGPVSGGTVYKCDICGHILAVARQMMVHKLLHENKFMCHVCTAVFDSFLARRDHIKAEHHKLFPCSICGKVLVGKYSLNRHINDHNGIKKFACEFCDMRFSQKSIMKRHVFRKHNPQTDFEQNKTKCDICKKSFKNIVVHIDRHHNKRCACNICGKTYADNSALNRHKAQKHFGRTFDCEICGKKYMQRSKLNTHMFKVHKIKKEINNSESVTENKTLSVME